MAVRLGLNLGYWGMGNDANNLALAREADRLGYAVVWVAEAYGSDAVSILSWIAAQTTRIDIGSAIMQIPARTPAMTAMTAATLDTLSGGRFRLGLGVSGPQVSEGWHGVPFAKPLARTREYVDIVRKALAREKLTYEGETYRLPLPGGVGKPLHLTIDGGRPDLPIYLASIGPKNLQLTGEVADGWLGLFFDPEFAPELLADVAIGRAKAGKTLEGFDVVPTMPLIVDEDIERAADYLRPNCALYVGGMGSRDQNFYNALAVRMGFDEAASRVQDLYLARDYAGAAAAIPTEFVDRTALIGTLPRLAEKMAVLSKAGVTTLTISPRAGSLEDQLRTLDIAQQALQLSGAGE